MGLSCPSCGVRLFSVFKKEILLRGKNYKCHECRSECEMSNWYSVPILILPSILMPVLWFFSILILNFNVLLSLVIAIVVPIALCLFVIYFVPIKKKGLKSKRILGVKSFYNAI